MHRAPPRSIFPSTFCHLLHYDNHVASLALDRSLDKTMAMTMADDYYAGDLDDVVHRLLPQEILANVGIVVPGCGAQHPSCAVTRRRGDDHAAAVVEDLAAHLVGILGLDAPSREQQRAPRPHLHQHVHEQGRLAGMGNGSRATVGGSQYLGGAARHEPSSSCWNGPAAPRVPRFEVPAMNSHPPARCHGTGVFLPRVEAYAQNRASPSPRNGAKLPRVQRREAAVVVAMRQQQLQLRAMAAEMQRRREAFAFAAAFQFHGCPAIVPPQQWTY